MSGAALLRDQHVERSAQHLVAGVAEDALALSVREADDAAPVDGDDRIRRRLRQSGRQAVPGRRRPLPPHPRGRRQPATVPRLAQEGSRLDGNWELTGLLSPPVVRRANPLAWQRS